MNEKKLYYLGTGTEFVKTQCKEYKTLDGALKAAAKDESLVVWDEDGTIIGSLTDNVPDGVLKTNPDGSVPVFDANGNIPTTGQNTSGNSAECGKNEQNEVETEKNTLEQKSGVNEENTQPKTKGNEQTSGGDAARQQVSEPDTQGTTKVTVICDGTINLRRSPSWQQGNECGRASRGQFYYVKAIHIVDGKEMVETVDGIFLSGQSEHVKLEQV